MPTAKELGVEILCKHGHPVTKFKKLRPWQGHMKDRACRHCARLIDRHSFRWRCESHCDYDVCEVCYNVHWKRVVRQAAETTDPVLRHALIEVVPDRLRPSATDPAFASMASALSPSAAQRAAAAVAATRKNLPGNRPVLNAAGMPLTAEEQQQMQQYLDPTQSASLAGRLAFAEKLGVPLYAVVWGLAALGYSHSIACLLDSHETPALFPDPWLLSAFTHLGGAAFCKLVTCGLRFEPREEEAVDTMSSSVLGVMMGVENGLYAKVLADSMAEQRHDGYVLRPAILAVAGILGGTSHASGKLGIVTAMAVFGSFLAAYGGPSLSGFFDSFPWLILAGSITVFRWVFTLNVLPRYGVLAALWSFAGQMLWPSGIVGFEIGFLEDYKAYPMLLHLPDYWEVLKMGSVAAVCCGTQLFCELTFVQKAGLATLGLATPMVQVLALFRGGGTLVNYLGILLYFAAVAIEVMSTWRDKQQQTDLDAYRQLETGGVSQGRYDGRGAQTMPGPPPAFSTRMMPPQPPRPATMR